MRTVITVGLLLVHLVATPSLGVMLDCAPKDPRSQPLLDQKVEYFQLIDESLIDGIAKLSQLPIELHVGVEEILGDTFSDPVARSVRFSVKLQNKTVREILDALCQSDARYIWSSEQATINVYPRATVGDEANLLNRSIQRIDLKDIPGPEQALAPLNRLLPPPKQQLGYSQLGGDSGYAEPWTVVFQNVTVRQFIDRIAEHMGPRTSWFWRGTKQERFFTFLRGGVRTEHQSASNIVAIADPSCEYPPATAPLRSSTRP